MAFKKWLKSKSHNDKKAKTAVAKAKDVMMQEFSP